MRNSNKCITSPATEMLSKLGINYKIIPHPDGVRSVRDFARLVGIQAERVFKTMLLKTSQGKHFLLICPGTEQVDFKQVQKYLGSKISLAPRNEVVSITGYMPNSVSPFGIQGLLPIYMDERLLDGEHVYLGSGVPGVDIEIKSISVLESLMPICLRTAR